VSLSHCSPGQVREVDAELEAYHRSNAELDALIGRLRAHLDELQVRTRVGCAGVAVAGGVPGVRARVRVVACGPWSMAAVL
jgi:hypothetical protein